MDELYSTIGTSTPDNLIAGNEFPILTKYFTLAKNQGVLKRGTVIGIVTATKLGVPVDNTKEDGSEKAYCILTDSVDTTADDDIPAIGYITGIFNAAALTFGKGTAADFEDQLRDLGIYLKDIV
jgi:hypothetical protein